MKNATANRPYHGINTVLLGMSPYSDQRWLTFKQVDPLGGNVRKGERPWLCSGGNARLPRNGMAKG